MKVKTLLKLKAADILFKMFEKDTTSSFSFYAERLNVLIEIICKELRIDGDEEISQADFDLYSDLIVKLATKV